jgi:hypothetical protein
MINQAIIISEVINKLTDKHPNAYFLLDGYCKKTNNKEINEDIIEYNKVVENIEKNIVTQNYKSLINLELNELIEYYNICDYAIYQCGSICCLSSWLCNIDGLQIGLIDVKKYEKIDKNIKQYCPKIIYHNENILYHNDCYEISSDTIVNSIPTF